MIYVIRHGKTDWNVRQLMQGDVDVPLNEAGREDAVKAREANPDLPVDICYCSPLVRAKETAEIFLEGRNIPVIPDNRLREMCFGVYEGELAMGDFRETGFYEHPEDYRTPEGGESFEEVFARTGDFIREVLAPLAKEGKNVLIAGHGVMNCAFISQLEGTGVKDIWKHMQRNGAVYMLDWKP